MEQVRWSDYATYLVLSDKAGYKLKGNYYNFQDFKIVMEIIQKLANSDNVTYTYLDNIYKRKINWTIIITYIFINISNSGVTCE